MDDVKLPVPTRVHDAAVAYQRTYAAKDAADTANYNAHRELRVELEKAYGEGCEITSELCRSKFGRHIYTPAMFRGVGHRKCIFCGTQDYED